MHLKLLSLLAFGLASTLAQRLGDDCTIDADCPANVNCIDAKCGGAGACTPDNNAASGTGLSDQCDRYSICVSNMCDTRVPNGLPCNDQQQCASDICQNGVCSDGSCSSDSDCPFQCANGRCVGFCSTDSDCPDGLGCAGNGRCGDVGASCFPNVFSPDNAGVSDQCASTLTCIDGGCVTPGPNDQGGRCASTRDCDRDLHCIRGTCSSQIPANTGDFCETTAACLEDGDTCVDNTCESNPNPGQSQIPIPRRNLQLPWMQAQCARPGDIACPVASINSRNAYEVGQIPRHPLMSSASTL